MMRSIVRPILLAMAAMQIGCSSGPKSSLALWDGANNVANYSFNQTLWRSESGDANDVEFVGYGLIPFNNVPMSQNYDPRWPPSGWATYYLHLTPQTGGKYGLMILGPSSAIGPGDNEVLTGVIDHPQIDTVAKTNSRTMTINKVSIHSRNFPDKAFTISGTIIAKPGGKDEFDREVHTIEQQLSWRGPP